MRSKIITVTPNMASIWLSSNTKNRPLRRALVSFYSDQMKKGEWKLTHQGIAFSSEGVLIDGQHRLRAICESGVAVQMLVIEGVDEATMIVVDDHAKRSPCDTMIVCGVDLPKSNEKEFVATARAMMVSSNWSWKWTKTDLLNFIKTHRDSINHSLCLFQGHIHVPGVTCATVASVIARAWYNGVKTRGLEFAEVLKTGVVQSNDDTAAIRLRDILSGVNGKIRGSRDVLLTHKRTERALYSFNNRLPLVKIYPAEKELFPLPDEVK